MRSKRVDHVRLQLPQPDNDGLLAERTVKG
jgi:hypothetical protein